MPPQSTTIWPFLVVALLAASGPASAQVPDSLAVASGDSLLSSMAGPDTLAATVPDSFALRDQAPIPLPWVDQAPVGERELVRARPELVPDVVALLPTVVVRRLGEPGARLFVDFDAVSGGAPEYWHDGVPSNSPADTGPGLYDRSAIGLGALRGGPPP